MSYIKYFNIPLEKENFDNSRMCYSKTVINIKYNTIMYKIKKKENQIYASINTKLDYDLNYNLCEIYLSKIYIHTLNVLMKDLFTEYNNVFHSDIFNEVYKFLGIGNYKIYAELYKILTNKMLSIKK